MSGSWEKHGQVFVAPIGFDTFYPLTKFPIRSLADLRGRKLAGAGAVSLWEAPIGIVPVQGNFSVHFNNLKTGVYDGLIAFTTGYYPNKLHEIARYATKVNFGAMPGGGVTVNKSVWGKLSDEVKKAVHEAALDYRDAQDKTMTRLVATFETKMAQEGTVFSEMPQDQKLAWAKAMPNIAKEWAARVEAKGFAGNKVLKAYMDKLRANKVPLVREWDQ
jgi:TRAP-type C4-dicarboxylate transport system substrate-binding protein